MGIENSFNKAPQEVAAEELNLEERTPALQKEAKEILRQAKERGDWVKEWTPEEDEKFIEGYSKMFEGIEDVANFMPEQTPPALINIGGWGRETKLGFEWTRGRWDTDKNSTMRPAVKIDVDK